MNNIFTSYRRGDSGPTSGRMFDTLQDYFGRGAIFKDVDSIPVGASFPAHLASVLETCVVTLIVIGPRWLSIADEQGHRRLDAPEDFVRMEVEAALRGSNLVIPVLVDGATMPPIEQLPPSIRSLARLNATQVRPDPDYHIDMTRLIKIVEQYLLSRTSGQVAQAMPAKYQPDDVYRSQWKFLLTCAVVVALALILIAVAAIWILSS